MKSKLFTHPEYKKVIDGIFIMEQKIKNMEQEKIYSVQHLADLKRQAKEAAKQDLKNFFHYRSNEIEEKLKEIEQSFQKDYYEGLDTQKELLKRQDITRKLKLSEDSDLKQRVEEFKKTGQGESIELEMLELELKERGLDQERIHLKAYVEHYDINHPYRKDETYQELTKESSLITAIKDKDFFYVATDNEGEADFRNFSY